MPGHWYEVKPKKLKASHRPEEWVFAYYLELGYQREDGEVFRAFLFRNRERTVFGAAVFRGNENPTHDSRDWATRVILNKEFRERHVTEDQSIITLWKHH